MKNIQEELTKIEEDMSEAALQVFDVVTGSIMKEFPIGTVTPKNIIDALEAVIRVTKMNSETDSKEH